MTRRRRLTLLLRASLAAALAAAAGGCAPSDNSGDCAALLSAYKSWGSRPTNWRAGIAAGGSYCAWDPYIPAKQGANSSGSIACNGGGRVAVMCVAPANSAV